MSAVAYYNEIDPFAAQWLRHLIAAGHLPAGDVDERSIADVRPSELDGYAQCHFFAGIGGWPYALRLAGWPDGRQVWTGSCPCQPLSSAGQRRGHADERHLWPAFYRLVAERRPATLFGEQVAGALGREWLAGVRADLEAAGYAIGAADLCAAGVGAPHMRQRLFWMARGVDLGMADAERRRRDNPAGDEREHAAPGQAERFAAFDKRQLGKGCPAQGSGLADAGRPDIGRSPEIRGAACAGEDPASREGRHGRDRLVSSRHRPARARFWDDAEWLSCTDGRARRAQPGIFPLADGVPGRVGMLRGAGNAIVPQVAAEFVAACRATEGGGGMSGRSTDAADAGMPIEAIACAFCGRGRSQVAWLFCNRARGRLGRGSAICDFCVDRFATALGVPVERGIEP